MTLRNLSDKEIKTINGGMGYEFPITQIILGGILGTIQNMIDIAKVAINVPLGMLVRS